MQKRWLVDLTDAERSELDALTRRGNAPARKIAHARVLLLAADGLTNDEIAVASRRDRSLVERMAPTPLTMPEQSRLARSSCSAS